MNRNELAPALDLRVGLPWESQVEFLLPYNFQEQQQVNVAVAPAQLVSDRWGNAIGDFMRPDRVVIGAESDRAREVLRRLYRPLYLIEAPIVFTGIEAAELTKYAANAFLALKAILDTCEQLHLPIALVMMPEGQFFRSFYPAGMQEHLTETFTTICRERRVLLVNARDWLAEEEMYDSHHAVPAGAVRFSTRLRDEVLKPLVRVLPLRSDNRIADLLPP